MASYQYETSPRKIKPIYRTTKKPKTTTKVATKKQNKKTISNGLKVKIVFNAIFIFAILFGLIYQNAQVSQIFSQIQGLKSQATEIQKENSQIEISIQNELNLSNIEETAKNMLGMQKLTSAQTRYVNLSKRDYVEPSTEEVIIEENTNIVTKVFKKVISMFQK